MLKPYNFIRLRNGKPMAEGIRIHAKNRSVATIKALATNWLFDEGKHESIKFVDNEPCAEQCWICCP